MNYKQVIARQQSAEKRWLVAFPKKEITNQSGIYILTRVDESGIKYAYIGQAKKVLTRLGQHLLGYQHIDLSLKSHRLVSEQNPYGWNLDIYYCPIETLNDNERLYIKRYAENGYQLRNKTLGGQDQGKGGLDNTKAPKGYYDGVEYGKKAILRQIKVFFDKYLTYGIKDKPNKVKERKLKEFGEMLNEAE